MDRDELRARLLEVFLLELAEHITILNRELLALEADPSSSAPLTVLKRTIHTLKGASRAVSLGSLQEICHALEGLFEKNGAPPLSDNSLQLAFEAADAIQEFGEKLKEEKIPDESGLDSILHRLEQAANASQDTALPSASPAPVKLAACPAPVAPSGESAGTRPGSMRIVTDKLDSLLFRSDRLLISSRRLERFGDWLDTLGVELNERGRQKIGELSTELRKESWALSQSMQQLSDEIRTARMVPFSEALLGLDREVRDLCRSQGKSVELRTDGTGLELDRELTQQLKSPLLHLVRNAVDHGLETPSERRAANKPERGVIRIDAVLSGSRVVITVGDDGTGIDRAALRARAAEQGVTVPEDDDRLLELVFLPGLSTSARVTEVSGRGIGLDVVKSTVESLRGSVRVRSQPGQRTEFELDLPLTLTTMRALLVKVGDVLCAVPSSSIARIREIGTETVRQVDGQSWITLNSSTSPVIQLSRVLGTAEPSARKAKLFAVQVRGEEEAVLVVDELGQETEILIKRLGRRLGRLKQFSGATVLPDGRIALILNPHELIRAARASGSGRVPAGGTTSGAAPTETVSRKRILIAEDSLTTRTLEKTILEAAGYEVLASADGEEAWNLLQRQGADLVISDIEMPNRDGFSLLHAIRASQKFSHLPVILVTALFGEDHRRRSIEEGASAYIVKSEFDQKILLEAIGKFI